MSSKAITHACQRTGHLLAALAFLLVSLVAVSVSTASPASALCEPSTMDGEWHNIDADTRSITRVNLTQGCGPRLCDTSGRCSSPPPFTIETFGACYPTDCEWGAEPMKYMGDDWYRAVYERSWATKYVWAREYGSYLRVWVWTDFHDGRTDYASNNWMRK